MMANIWNMMLKLSLLGGISTLKVTYKNSVPILIFSKMYLLWTILIFVMNVVHCVWIPTGIKFLLEDNVSIVFI